MSYRQHGPLAVLFTEDIIKGDVSLLEKFLNQAGADVIFQKGEMHLFSSVYLGEYFLLDSADSYRLQELEDITAHTISWLKEHYTATILFKVKLGNELLPPFDQIRPPTEIALRRNRVGEALREKYGYEKVQLYYGTTASLS